MQKSADVRELGSSLDVGNSKVCSGEESEEESQTEESYDEENVDAESSDEEDETHKRHGDSVEPLRCGPRSTR